MKETKKYRVRPGHRFKWDDVDPDDKGSFDNEAAALDETEDFIRKLDPLQERLYAEGTRGLLIVLQGVDAGGSGSRFSVAHSSAGSREGLYRYF
jgi:polyphosphate kinase 2 (PPK2 family)